MSHLTTSKGITLIELLVVVAILGILTSIGTIGYQSFVSGSNFGSNKTILLKYLQIFKDVPYIFNLGHGILPETKPETVDYLVKFVKDAK